MQQDTKRGGVAKTNALRSAGSTSPGLARWHSAVSEVNGWLVLPMGFGGERHVTTAAWHGDKVLGAAVARELQAQCVGGQDELTRRFCAAVSNEHMAAHLDQLLPLTLLTLLPPAEERAAQVHDCGTLLEACVERVHHSGGADAIEELARYLLATATDTDADASEGEGGEARARREANPKGRLLELGGSVGPAEQVGGASHSPLFRAAASLGERRLTAEGGSKKAAEKAAAAALLASAGVHAAVLPTQRLDLARTASEAVGSRASEAASAGRPLRWSAVAFREADLAAELKDGEDGEAWFRRRPTLHRSVCAPLLFPDAVRAVDAWQARLDDGALAMVRVQAARGGEGATRVFVTPAPTSTGSAARRAAGVLAHAHITALLDLQLSGSAGDEGEPHHTKAAPRAHSREEDHNGGSGG
ncbi:hypothetical protein EMIHUDRAFT_232352 [Emiliania huxleyi CCMP1516]|uniref:DRBM domain-containing protein n=2 Tax=Emiliania huxleyi TaxID=2903 RepID=A0A0D3K4S9_EMIH1|nr:hypothetical protein EMIHUDRAFT_232352 [Emiliania huxleyi CCMP1516]EOD30764.1 hypothetical protein EMIHUDRAFT_232352 [Emiliania huxleyi CCMP1516]|eukprot:XP_005783193.1 hypothetical protein EMIHUDRAFT_232352 [Emiliania huxleyi CCMP1516]